METQEGEIINEPKIPVLDVDTDFVLTANIADLTNYKNSSLVISCRVYQ